MNLRHLLLALACAGLLPLHALAAASILIWPIDPWLAADQRATELWLENRGDSTTIMQVRIVRWQQENGFERYQAQQDVVASPPMLSLSAGGKQLIRLIKQGDVPAGKEYAYRIIIDEIPQPEQAGVVRPGLKLQMRYSIPLFAYGQGTAARADGAHRALTDASNLSWRVIRRDGKPALQVENRGGVHLRLSQVSLTQNGARREVAQGLLGYVLPGQARSWPLPSGLNNPSGLTATINARETQWHSTAAN